MRNLILIIVGVFSLQSLAHYNPGWDDPPTPLPAPAKPSLKKGETFYVSGDGNTQEDAVARAEYEGGKRAREKCISGRARRIEGWDVNYYDLSYSGECVEVEHVKLCEPDTEWTFYSANATYKCL